MAKQDTKKNPPMYTEDFKVEETVNQAEVNDKDLEIPLYETEEVPDEESLVEEKKNVLQKYSAADAVIGKLQAKLAAIVKVETEEEYKEVYNTHQLIKRWYRFVEQVRSKGKKPLLELGRIYDAEAKRIEQLLDGVDNKCSDLRKPWEEKKEEERLKKAKEEAEKLNERISKMQSFGMVLTENKWKFKDIEIDATDLRSMPENVWSLVLKQIEEEYTKDQAEKQAQEGLLRKQEEERQRELDELKAKNEAFEKEKKEREEKEEAARLAREKADREFKEERFLIRLDQLKTLGISYDSKSLMCTFQEEVLPGYSYEAISEADRAEFLNMLYRLTGIVEKANKEAEEIKKRKEQELAAEAHLQAKKKADDEERANRRKILEDLGCEIADDYNWYFIKVIENFATKKLEILNYPILEIVDFDLFISDTEQKIYTFIDEFNKEFEEYKTELAKQKELNKADREEIVKFLETQIDFSNLERPRVKDPNLALQFELDLKKVTDEILTLIQKYKD